MTSRPRPDRADPDAGFTLIETIIVLVVMGLMAGLLISRGPMHSPTVDLRSAATQLLQGLRAARSQSIAAGQPQLFTIQPEQHSYRIGDSLPKQLPPTVSLGLAVGGHPAHGIDFYPDGSSGGGTVTLQTSGRRMSVSVDWLSGRMHVAELTP
jgi:general secretion pathway protein H